MMNDGKAQRATDRKRDNELNANGSGCLFGGSAAKAAVIIRGEDTMFELIVWTCIVVPAAITIFSKLYR